MTSVRLPKFKYESHCHTLTFPLYRVPPPPPTHTQLRQPMWTQTLHYGGCNTNRYVIPPLPHARTYAVNILGHRLIHTHIHTHTHARTNMHQVF